MRAVLFDVDGVLVHGYHARSELRRCWDENLMRDFGIDRERFKREFIFGPFVREVIIGKRDLRESLSAVLPDLGSDCDPQTFINYWLKNDSYLNHDLLDKIKTLKESGKVRLFIATNQEHNRARYLMTNLGLNAYFEDIFYSARIGHLKPAREYFEFIEDRLSLPPGEKPIFFDDTPNVIEGARARGWEAVEFLNAGNLHDSPYVKSILTS